MSVTHKSNGMLHLTGQICYQLGCINATMD